MTVFSSSPAPAAVATDRRRRRRNVLVGWSFILPNFLGFAALTLVPVAGAFLVAFTDWDAYSTPDWVGFANFSGMLGDPIYWASVVKSMVFAFATTGLGMALALLMALLADRELRGYRVYRTVLVWPCTTLPRESPTRIASTPQASSAAAKLAS